MKSLRLNDCSIRQVPSTRSSSIRRYGSLSNIRDLDLTDSGVDDSTVDRLIASVADNPSILKRLKLRRNPSITPRGWATLMPFFQSCKLTSLDLSHNLIDDDIAIRLAHSLVNNDTLKKLDLSHNEHITSTGFAAFALLFQSPVTRLESFHLIGNTICDDVAVTLADSLSENRALKRLWLGRSNLITSRGLLAFSFLLQNPNCQLNMLNFSRCHTQDDAAVALAASLVRNTKLKYLNLGEATSLTATGWGAFSHLLCNTSSFDSIYDSNHTLGLLGFGVLSKILPPEVSASAATVERYLEYNRVGGEQRSRQRKILDHYFCGDFSMEPFAGMEVQLLVHILAWISRSGCSNNARGTFALEHEIRCQSAMFNFMRSEPRVTDLVICSQQRARAGDELLVSWDDTDSSPRKFSWSSFWKQLLFIFHDNEVDKQPKQATTSHPAAKKKRVKKEESVGFMLYGDSMNDQVDQQIDFMLGLMDEDDYDDNLEDLRIILIDDDDHKGHTKLNEVINSLPATMWK